MLDSAKKAEQHFAKRHPNEIFALTCAKCTKVCPGIRSVSNHYVKCEGRPKETPPTLNRVVFSECPLTNENNSGLGQH